MFLFKLFFNFVYAFCLFVIDIFKSIKNKVIAYPYGVWLYVGLPGTGKTISVVEYLQRAKKKYPGIKIYTNFSYNLEDAPINGWQDLIDLPGPAIFVLDEVQVTFNSRDWKKFPPDIVTLLTQNRKESKQIIATAQSFERVDKVFRELTNYVIECNCYFGRLNLQKAFYTSDYVLFEDLRMGKPRRRTWRYSFVQTLRIRNSFDTLKRLKKLQQTKFQKERKD